MLLNIGVAGPEGEKGGRDVEAQGLGGRRLRLSKEGRRGEGLDMRIEQIGYQVAGKFLGGRSRLQSRGGFAEGQEDFVLSNCLQVRLVGNDPSYVCMTPLA